MVSPLAKRAAVRVAREEGRVSERRACGLLRTPRGSCRYRRKERNDAALRARLREIAAERPRFGYRRLHRMLRREGRAGDAAQKTQAISRRSACAAGAAHAGQPSVDDGFHTGQSGQRRKIPHAEPDGRVHARGAPDRSGTLRCRDCVWCGCSTAWRKSGATRKRFIALNGFNGQALLRGS